MDKKLVLYREKVGKFLESLGFEKSTINQYMIDYEDDMRKFVGASRDGFIATPEIMGRMLLRQEWEKYIESIS